MRVIYLSHVNLRSTRAHVHNTLKTCEALARAGAQVDLVCCGARPPDIEALLAAHRVRTPFTISFLGSVETEEITQQSRLRRLWAFLRMNVAFAKAVWRRKDADALYYRYDLLAAAALFWKWIVRKPVVFESHYVYINKPLSQAVTALAVRSATGVVAITDALRRAYGLRSDRSMMFPCHAAETELVPAEDVATLRRSLELPLDGQLLCYAGSLGATIQGISYEVETIVDLLERLPSTVRALIIGARDDRPDGAALLARAAERGVRDRVILRPWTDRASVMRSLCAADVLMLPRVGTAPGSSPSKMFDYLAAGRPIVGAHTPPVDEILEDGRNALLVAADDLEAWAGAVSRVLADPNLATTLAAGAHADAQRWTWQHRGERVLAFLQHIVRPRPGMLRRSAVRTAEFLLWPVAELAVIAGAARFGVVLGYHSVSESRWIHAVPPALFSRQLAWLHRRCRVVPLGTLATSARGNAAITFDDGYADWATVAWPALKGQHAPASFFVTTAFASVTTTPQNDLRTVTPQQITGLARDGAEIGSHSHTHADFSALDDGAAFDEAERSAAEIARLTGARPRAFSYPKGRTRVGIDAVLRRAGYETATGGHGVVRRGTDVFRLPRVPVTGDLPLWRFRSRVSRALVFGWF